MATSLAAAGAKDKDLSDLDGVNLLPFIEGRKKHASAQEPVLAQTLVLGDGRSWKLIYVQNYGYALYNLGTRSGRIQNLIQSEKKRSEQMITQLNDWKAGLEKPAGTRRKSGSVLIAKTISESSRGE